LHSLEEKKNLLCFSGLNELIISELRDHFLWKKVFPLINDLIIAKTEQQLFSHEKLSRNSR